MFSINFEPAACRTYDVGDDPGEEEVLLVFMRTLLRYE